MKYFTIEPRDPLFVRDGRPMNPGPGAARSLSFPLPLTLAGLVRSRLGCDPTGLFCGNPQQLLSEIGVVGPLLCKLDVGNRVEDVFVAAPRDLVWFDTGTNKLGHRLCPLESAEISDVKTDIPHGLGLVGFAEAPGPAKATHGAAFWPLEAFMGWLEHPTPTRLPVAGPELQRETRVHVAIDPAKGTAAQGMLFSTEALRFENRKERYALLGGFSDDRGRTMADDVVNLGGERRVSYMRATEIAWPPPLPKSIRRLSPGDLARIVLLSPAIFPEGSLPKEVAGATVVAAVVPRPEVVSGWDLARKRPKESRRMVAPGAVYWVRIPPQEGWVNDVWMKSVCPAEQDQDRRDGFGIAALGVA